MDTVEPAMDFQVTNDVPCGNPTPQFMVHLHQQAPLGVLVEAIGATHLVMELQHPLQVRMQVIKNVRLVLPLLWLG